MKIENEIKQRKFKNEYHKLAVNLMYTYGWLMNYQSSFIKKFGVSTAQYNILRILRGQYPNPASVILLKERMLDKMSDASRIVERLKQKGLLEREICSDDRRRVEVKINEKGLALLKEMDKLEEKIGKLFKALKPDEAKKLNALLDKLRG
jgi:DNA-binding MarR family transcriptional regulator